MLRDMMKFLEMSWYAICIPDRATTDQIERPESKARKPQTGKAMI